MSTPVPDEVPWSPTRPPTSDEDWENGTRLVVRQLTWAMFTRSEVVINFVEEDDDER